MKDGEQVIALEIRVLRGLINRPSREAARHFRDVFLRVTAVDAKRVQLHQFASVVLVQPALVFLRLRIAHWTRRPGPAESSAAPLLARRALHGLSLPPPWISAQKIVQVKKHRRALSRASHQILRSEEHTSELQSPDHLV